MRKKKQNRELTAIGGDETTLGLHQSRVGQEHQSAVQLAVLPPDVLHTVFTAVLAHTPADLLSPTQVATH